MSVSVQACTRGARNRRRCAIRGGHDGPDRPSAKRRTHALAAYSPAAAPQPDPSRGFKPAMSGRRRRIDMPARPLEESRSVSCHRPGARGVHVAESTRIAGSRLEWPPRVARARRDGRGGSSASGRPRDVGPRCERWRALERERDAAFEPPDQNANLPVAGSDPACGRNSPTNFEHRWCRSGCEPRCQTSLVNDSALIRARAGDHQAFAALTDPYRRELQLHCYRILGQVQDAEDAVQETLLSAWRALESFEERSTLRSWLYRIATNRCLNMLRDSGRRPATAAGVASTPPEPTRYGEVLWLEPYPDALLEGHRRRRGRSGGPLRDPRGGNARVPHRASSPPAPPARRARASRRAGVLRH